MNECGKDECFDELMHNVIRCLQRSKDFGESKEFTSKHIWRVFDEKVE
jgi:hypothetical protein